MGSISIIVPVFNVEAYLRRCVDSILCRQENGYELILVDDGSTDGSGAICDAYASDPRVLVIHRENGGPSAARNAGLEAAQGRYIWFVDADDRIEPGAISVLLDRLDGQDMLLFGADDVRLDPSGRYLHEPRVGWSGTTAPRPATEDEIIGANVTLWNKLIRRDRIGENRFRTDLGFGEDAELYHRIVGGLRNVLLIPDCLYHYRVDRPDSVTNGGPGHRPEELLLSARLSYEHLRSIGRGDIGIRRILTVIGQLRGALHTPQDLKTHRDTIRACRQTARYPSLRDQWTWLTHCERTPKGRLLYLSLLLDPWHERLLLQRRLRRQSK